MSAYLLDANVLIALFWKHHAHHEPVRVWFAKHRSSGWATCPLTESAFVRLSLNPHISQGEATIGSLLEVLEKNHNVRDHRFWPDDLPYTQAVFGLSPVGSQQVTDAYLLGLAASKGGILATLDKGVRNVCPSGSPILEHLHTINLTQVNSSF
jgi:uncharacterized protein